MTKRAEETVQLFWDKEVADILFGHTERSCLESDQALYPRAKAANILVSEIKVEKTAWLDRGRLEDAHAEMDTAPWLPQIDYQHVKDNVLSYLEELEQRYGA